MKNLPLLSIFLLFFSCSRSIEKSSVKIVTLANFKIEIDTSLSYLETNENMAMGKIIGKNISPLVLFNFGNKPISLQSNIKRWKGQLQEVENEKIETFQNELVYYVELEGLSKEGVKTFLISAIIPSDHGPFYLKTTCTSENYLQTKKEFKNILKSIDY